MATVWWPGFDGHKEIVTLLWSQWDHHCVMTTNEQLVCGDQHVITTEYWTLSNGPYTIVIDNHYVMTSELWSHVMVWYPSRDG